MRTALALLFGLLGTQGCHHRPTSAPYARGDGPDPATLIAAAAPRYRSLRVPKAKIREGRSPGARLQLLAEAPARMLGSIDIAGNPVVALALHEQGYALRSVRDAPGLAAGFYSGPPSDCAVRGLLGVDLEPVQIVALLLGGGPVIEGPHDILDHRWSDGREHLRVGTDRYEEEFEFAWIEERWWFAGASLHARSSVGPVWLWTIRHDDLEVRNGFVVPTKTKIIRPDGAGGSTVLSIAFAEQHVTPGVSELDAGDPGAGDSGDSGNSGDGGGGWNDEGWEDDDEPAPAPASVPDPIPPAYRIQPGGLVDRGDLCAP